MNPRDTEGPSNKKEINSEETIAREKRFQNAQNALDRVLDRFNSKHKLMPGQKVRYYVRGGYITLVDLPRDSDTLMADLRAALEKDERFMLWVPEGWLNYYFVLKGE